MLKFLSSAAALAVLTLPLQAQSFGGGDKAFNVWEQNNGDVLAADSSGTYVFDGWEAYHASLFFKLHGKCGQAAAQVQSNDQGPVGSQADCSSTFTNPGSEYAPSGQAFRVPVVVHVLQRKNGKGYISPAQVQAQVDILNEDFLALAGSNGANGSDTNIEFYLATSDPSGAATTGITYHKNNGWYNDSGVYYNSIGWDTTRYLNIYTNTAGGNLGYAYVPSSGGVVGQSWDRVVIFWRSFGRDTGYAPYDQGRTVTHEVGHYLGLYHTFGGGCADPGSCASNGDLICDTNPESSPNYSYCSRVTCGSSDPVKNYMDYSEDLCMDNFTSNQARRMRCTLENFRVGLWSWDNGDTNSPPSALVESPADGSTYSDGDVINFVGTASDAEDGNLTSSISWSSNLDGSLGGGGAVSTALSVGVHTVTASVTDSGGASGSDSIQVTVQGSGGFTLLADAYKVKGRVSVDLSWSGAATGSVDIYRDGAYLTTTSNDGAYTDVTGKKGGGSITYQMCETGGGACSNTATANY